MYHGYQDRPAGGPLWRQDGRGGLRPVMSGQDADMEPGADCRRNTKKSPAVRGC